MKKQQLVKRDQGPDYNYSMDHCFVKLSSTDTDGELAIVEDKLKPGFKLPRHHHKEMAEVFYVLDGEVEFTFDDETVTIKPGDTLVVPPNVWHAAKCKNGGRMLTIFKNGRFDEYLDRLNEMTSTQFENKELMTSLNEEFDNYFG